MGRFSSSIRKVAWGMTLLTERLAGQLRAKYPHHVIYIA
jgi:hypothetical protein